jgi:type I restriction enzyme R subunit
VGIFENLEKALAFDSDFVASIIQNIDLLKNSFETMMKTKSGEYLALVKGRDGDKVVERAIDYFADKGKREEFFKFFNELETLYDIISPDAFLRPYLEDYGKLADLYKIIRNAYAKHLLLIEALTKKTEELVKKTMTAKGLESTLRLYTIDEKTLEALKKDSSSDNTKVINLAKSLAHAVLVEVDRQPYLRSIGERAQAILEQYDDRQVSTKGALSTLEKLLEEYNQAQKERAAMNIDINTFSIYWVLKQNDVQNCEAVASKIETIFKRYLNYKQNAAEKRALKAELYKLLLPAVGKDQMVELAEKLLKLERRGNLS